MTQAAVVTVVRFWLEIARNRVRVVRRWEITYGAYRAVIDECPCGLYGAIRTGIHTPMGKRTNCLCRAQACRNRPERKGVCHGWHQARVDDMVRQIEQPKAWKPGVGGVSHVEPRDMVGLRGRRWEEIYG